MTKHVTTKQWQGVKLQIVGNAEQWEDSYSFVGKPSESLQQARRSAVRAAGHDDLLYVQLEGDCIYDIVGYDGKAIFGWGDEDFEAVAKGLEMELVR